MKKFGLTDEEVLKSREQYGSNSLTEVETESFWDKFKENLGDPMIKILCVALIINVVLTFMGQAEWYESVGIAIAVALATFVSTFSEYRNENSFKKLQDEASKIVCKVYRNGSITEVFIDDIVKGDYILLQTGDKIPADGIMRDSTISVDQSVLNGESEEATKVAVAENYEFVDDGTEDFMNENRVFRGTIVCSGNGVMEVTTIGDTSVYGKIASELQEADDRESPLKVKLNKLAHSISMFGYIGGVAIAIAFLFQRIFIHNGFDLSLIAAHVTNVPVLINDIVSAIILAVIIVVVAVPEGLPLMIAIVSAQNMGKMLKDNVLVREINGIETAGSLNLLFSDKTGTITKGQLEVVNFINGDCIEHNQFSDIPTPLGDLLALGITQNSTAVIAREGDTTKIIGGNGTDRAVLGFVPTDREAFQVEQVSCIPFNSTNKYAATCVKGEKSFTLLKGAPEKIIEKCQFYFDEQGQKQSFTNVEALEERINELANRAIRVLAVAVHEDQIVNNKELPADGYTLVGVLGIRDEVRPESIHAIHEGQNAGVQVVMITGDRKDTAVAIAKEAGLLTADTDVVLTSDELRELTDEQIKEKLPNLRVVSRALPSDKSRLVTVAQEMNLVVGMTGDGVNDSPALKKADVGFAMGSGTEVAKEASDIVILDDNFNSIDRAILYGRTIFNNIRKFIIFQLTINVAAVLVSFVCPLLGMENPLSITQFLWVNLVMDTLAALAFGGEPALQRYMKERPKRRDESIISKNMWSQILTGSIWTFIVSMVFLLGNIGPKYFRPDPLGEQRYLLTGYFALFIFMAVFNAFNARTEKINLFDNISKNHGFHLVFISIAVIQILMTYIGGEVLRCYGLNLKEWAVVLVLAITIIPIDLIRKLIVGKRLDS